MTTEPGAATLAIEAVALLELHDARIESIVVEPGRRARLVFGHIAAFVERAPDLYDVLSCTTSLVLDGLEEVLLCGGLSAQEYVSEGRFQGPSGEEMSETSVLQSGGARRLDLIFGSGASLSCRFGSARFEPLVRRCILEQWSGPLVAAPGER